MTKSLDSFNPQQSVSQYSTRFQNQIKNNNNFDFWSNKSQEREVRKTVLFFVIRFSIYSLLGKSTKT